jgi:hemolysin activation/secretion protein
MKKTETKMKMQMAQWARPDSYRIAVAALVLALGGPLLGQTFEQVAPQPVREGAAPVPAQPAQPAAPAPEANSNEVLVPNLTGLRLIPSADRVSKTALAVGQPLVIEDLLWLDRGRVEAVAKDYVSHPLTRKGLSELVRALVLVCRKSDRPVVDIYAPPQDVSTGVVQLIVLVAKLGKVHTEGNQWFAGDILTRDIRLKPGNEITGQTLLEDMDLLNQNPFRQVDLVYARGDGYGLTDVILRVHDRRPDRVYAGYDDTGNESTGLGRVFVGLNMGDVFNQDQQFSYQYTRSTYFERLQANSASYSIPLPWRNTFEIFGDWALAKTDSENIIDLTGKTWEVGVRYTIPLPMIGPSYSQSFDFGADYKWSNNNLAFGGTQVFTSPVNVAQGVLGYTAAMVDSLGTTQGALTGFFSPGGIGDLNHDHDFIVQRAGARTQYEYVQLNITRIERLPADFTSVLAISSQWASTRLLPIDEFGLGGALSVRGYDERIVNGDDGVSAQLEFRTPSRHLLKSIPDQTQALVFVDAGRDWNNDPIPGEVNNTLASAGPGLRISIGTHGTLKADYGWQLERLAGTRRGRPHISAVFSY